MKKSIMGIAIGVLATIFLAGCNIQPEQVSVIAQNAGLFSAVGWIAVDNPDAEAINAVKNIIEVIETKASDVQSGTTYTEAIYPELVKIIDSDMVAAQYRPVCKAGALSILGGIDMLFATNPEWKVDQDTAISVVKAFILGANSGLGLKETDPIMEAARSTAAARARVLK